MSNFTEFSSIRLTESNLFELWEDLVYEHRYKGSGIYIVAPKGFKTDLVSIPWVLQVFVKPQDHRWVKSGILHDYLWSQAKTLLEYQTANDVFYEAMIIEGTPKYLAIFAYLSVSISKYIYWVIWKNKLDFYSKKDKIVCMPTIHDTYNWFYIKSEIYKVNQRNWYTTKRATCVCLKCNEEKDRIVSTQMKCWNCKYVERLFDRWDYYEIELSNWWFAKIDKEDIWKVKNYLWYKTIRNSIEARIGKKLLKIHRVILDAKDWEYIDHINRDFTDNRKGNLRFCTIEQNSLNKGKRKNCTSKYKNVYLHSENLWIARAKIWETQFYKSFNNEEEAAIWIDWKINEANCSFSQTNKSLWIL